MHYAATTHQLTPHHGCRLNGQARFEVGPDSVRFAPSRPRSRAYHGMRLRAHVTQRAYVLSVLTRGCMSVAVESSGEFGNSGQDLVFQFKFCLASLQCATTRHRIQQRVLCPFTRLPERQPCCFLNTYSQISKKKNLQLMTWPGFRFLDFPLARVIGLLVEIVLGRRLWRFFAASTALLRRLFLGAALGFAFRLRLRVLLRTRLMSARATRAR